MATPRLRIGLASCFHETNTFAESVTDEAAFRHRNGWLEGVALVEAFQSTRTVVGGMLDGAEHHDLEIEPVFGALATPAGIVTDETFQSIIQNVSAGLRGTAPLDGLLLELHGAMVVEGDADPETSLLRAIRSVIGDIPIVAVTDMHANMTARRARLLDGVIGYRTNPHVDTHESGFDAAAHLSHLLRGQLRSNVVHGSVPVIFPPSAQRTAEPPLLRLMATARELERRHRFLDVTVHAGFSFADVSHAGLSFTVTTVDDGNTKDATAAAQETIRALGDLAWEHIDEFVSELPSTSEAITHACRLARSSTPVAVADTGDNINGGAPGDTTWLLREALGRDAGRIGATLWDPASAQAAARAGFGQRFDAQLGGSGGPLSGDPLLGEATVLWLGDGTFRNAGPMAAGARVAMGPTAVIRVGSADVILQSAPVQPNDPEMFRSVGLDPADYALILLKGAAAIRAGWAPIVSHFVTAGTPGVTDCDLSRLPYQHLRPVWPLQPDVAELAPIEMTKGAP